MTRLEISLLLSIDMETLKSVIIWRIAESEKLIMTSSSYSVEVIAAREKTDGKKL